MLKLSKTHKIAEDEVKLPEPDALSGAEIEEELPDDAVGEESDGDEVKVSKDDPRQEAAKPHAEAAKELFNKRRELLAQVAALDEQLGNHREVLRALDPKMRHESYADDKELRNYLKPEKKEELKKRKKLDRKAEMEVIDGLLKVAELLDAAEDSIGVEAVESVLEVFAAEKKKSEVPQYDTNDGREKSKTRVSRDQTSSAVYEHKKLPRSSRRTNAAYSR